LPSVSQVLSKDAAGDALAILAAKGGVIATPTGSRHDAWAVCFKKDQVSVLWFGYDKAKTIADRSSITEALSRTIKSLD
jgi:membrane carboxypeptidase/penicillin-binding protein